MKKAFTMIELILIVVIMGVLSVIIMPKFFNIGVSSKISKLKAEYSSINTNIRSVYVKNTIEGKLGTYAKLEDSKDMLFSEVFKDGLKQEKCNSGWYRLGRVKNPATIIVTDGTLSENDPKCFDKKKLKDDFSYLNINGSNKYYYLYRYSVSSDIYFNFSFKENDSKFVCVKSVCKGCSKSIEKLVKQIACENN